VQVEEDNREILRLLRDPGVQEKLEGLKRLIAQSAWPGAAARVPESGGCAPCASPSALAFCV
jgi:hypothetical protein